MVLRSAEHNGLGHIIEAVVLKIVDDLSHPLDTIRQYNRAVIITYSVELLRDLIARVIKLPWLWHPPSSIFVEIDADDAIRGKEAFFNALFERVRENRGPKVGGVISAVFGVGHARSFLPRHYLDDTHQR